MKKKYSKSSSGFASMKKRTFIVDEESNIVAIAYGASDSEAEEAAEKITKVLNAANECGEKV